MRGALMAEKTFVSPVDRAILRGHPKTGTLETIRLFYSILQTGGVADIGCAVSPDWCDQSPPPDRFAGRAGLVSWIAALHRGLPDLSVVVHELIGDGANVAVRLSVTGTHLGPLFGIAPTARHFQFCSYAFHLVEDGLLSRTWHRDSFFSVLGRFRDEIGTTVSPICGGGRIERAPPDLQNLR